MSPVPAASVWGGAAGVTVAAGTTGISVIGVADGSGVASLVPTASAGEIGGISDRVSLPATIVSELAAVSPAAGLGTESSMFGSLIFTANSRLPTIT